MDLRHPNVYYIENSEQNMLATPQGNCHPAYAPHPHPEYGYIYDGSRSYTTSTSSSSTYQYYSHTSRGSHFDRERGLQGYNHAQSSSSSPQWGTYSPSNSEISLTFEESPSYNTSELPTTGHTFGSSSTEYTYPQSYYLTPAGSSINSRQLPLTEHPHRGCGLVRGPSSAWSISNNRSIHLQTYNDARYHRACNEIIKQMSRVRIPVYAAGSDMVLCLEGGGVPVPSSNQFRQIVAAHNSECPSVFSEIDRYIDLQDDDIRTWLKEGVACTVGTDAILKAASKRRASRRSDNDTLLFITSVHTLASTYRSARTAISQALHPPFLVDTGLVVPLTETHSGIAPVPLRLQARDRDGLKYLLRTLSSNLRALSSTATLSSPNGTSTPVPKRSNSQPRLGYGKGHHLDDEGVNGEGIEMQTLPLPSTHTPKSKRGFFQVDDTQYLHSLLARFLFSWCFAESCTLFFLLILQGLGTFSPETRLLNWTFSLYFLMFAILVLIPLSMSVVISIGVSSSTRTITSLTPRIFVAFLPVALYLFFLSYIPLPIGLKNPDYRTATLSRLIVLGTTVLGLLSGFGAVSNSWEYLPFTSEEKSVPTERDIDTAQYALNSIRNDLDQRTREVAIAARSRDEGPSSWLSRVGASFRGSDNLTRELEGLTALESQMARNLEALKERREAALYANTLRGMVFGLISRVFAIYCVLRIFIALYNVLFRSSLRSNDGNTYSDLLTSILSRILPYLPTFSKPSSDSESHGITYEDLASFSRLVSSVLVGAIILLSLRTVLQGVTRALRVTSKSLAVSVMVLVLAQIMGIYLLSTLVQMRASFPPPPSPATPDGNPSSVPINLFSTIPAYEVFGSVFDWSFLISAVVTGGVKWMHERVNGVGDM
ncbi:hypothetical protein CVT24_005454 [Panaeolus cyanescens]|uniref:Abscisic acid G-protein coupled receptor-like domain-containing protein n=1 Tax=Panaeolus cyanescens TaxID=181874 RepID=A0A409WGS1_9AGAR|nr:hypothetical protein CVT24_005454 [Panaeolus cyanescens]